MLYIIDNNNIMIARNYEALAGYECEIKVLPEDYEEGKYIVEDGELILNPNWEEEKARKERERLDALYMTRSDFFDGFIMAFGLSQVKLRSIVEQILNSINITDVEIEVALNNFDNALNFYRKHTLFTLLSNIEIPVTEDITLVFTSDIWDKFFDTKNYKELQKAIQVKPEPTPEPTEAPTEEPEEN